MQNIIAGIIFDIDGTLLRGQQVLPGVKSVLADLRRRAINVAAMTNDNRGTLTEWATRFKSVGVAIRPNEIITSAQIAARVAAQMYPEARILPVGDRGLVEALCQQNVRLLEFEDGISADVVVMGKDPDFNQTRLQTVCQHIWNGAGFIATNNDRKMPIAGGYIPATGAMVQAVAWATGVQPLVTGKPSRHAAQAILTHMGTAAEHTVMVGDSLTSDIALGRAAGMRTVLVQTGTHSATDAAALDPTQQPHHIIDTLQDLIPTLFGETHD